jgi:crotonobetainyl-CoA:carnitine CoA-transferase CaiB-like acyl-CoA transferase
MGFVITKGSPKGCEVGPWIVDPAASAWAVPALLEAVLHRLAGQSVELGVYGTRDDVQGWLIEHGFHSGFRTLRMTRGDPKVAVENVAGICAIGGLEKG